MDPKALHAKLSDAAKRFHSESIDLNGGRDPVAALYAERYRRRAEVRELARREGLNPEGARDLETLDYREAAVIGTAQTAALLAGISRDGVVMSAGLVRGLNNEDAARFAFLLATPPILLAGIYKFSDLTGPEGDGVRGAAILAAGGLLAIVAQRIRARQKPRSAEPSSNKGVC